MPGATGWLLPRRPASLTFRTKGVRAVTGNLYLDLLVSAGGVALLAAISYALGAWRTATADEAAARERLAFDEPDFSPVRWYIDAKGRAAVATSGDGREVAVVFAVGDALATRRMKTGALRVRQSGAALDVLLGDFSRRKLALEAPDAATARAWAAALGAEQKDQQ